MERRQPGLSFEGLGIKFRLHGYSIRTVIDAAIFASLVGLAILHWDAREDFTAAQKNAHVDHLQMMDSMRKLAAALRFWGCVTAQPEAQRERELARVNGACAQQGKE